MKRLPDLYLTWIIIICFTFTTHAQLPTPYFEHIDLENGTSVSQIIQDQQGYIWFATFSGLARYDGYSTKVFKPSENEKSLTDGRIRSLLEDSNGNLWVGTYSGGLNRFDRKTETFTAMLAEDDQPDELQSNGILSLYEDRSGNIWIGTYGGGISILPKASVDSINPRLINYLHNPEDDASLSDNTVMSFLEDSSGNIWVATWNGGINLAEGSLSNYRFTRFAHDPGDNKSLSSNTTFDLLEDSQGRIWVSTWGGGLNRMVKKGEREVEFIHYRHDADNPTSLSNDVVSGIFEDSEGVIWVGTYGKGLNRMINEDPNASNQFINYQNISSGSSIQLNEEVFCLYEDNQKNLWIGLYDLGVVKMDMNTTTFGLIKDQPMEGMAVASLAVIDVFEDSRGDLWIARPNGILDHYPNGITNEFPKQFKRYVHDPNDPNSPSSFPIYDMTEDAKGRIWMTTYGGGLTRMTTGNNVSFKHFKNNPEDLSSLSYDITETLIFTKQGDLWIGTQDGGLNRLPLREQDKENPKFIIYRNDTNDPRSISHNSITSLNTDSKGNLWVGTDGGGLNKLTYENLLQNRIEFQRFTHDSHDTTGLSHNVVYGSFVEDPDGTLWIGTHGGGLCRMNPKTETFRAYKEADGLCTDIIYNLLKDNAGYIWIVTNIGVCRFDPKTETFSGLYTEKNGMQGFDYGDFSNHKGRDGRLYFGGRNGFNAFFPEQITKNSFVPPVVITDFLLFNESVPIGSTLAASLEELDSIHLQYDQNAFTFEFSALSYRQSDRNQFLYRLDGFNKDWVPVSPDERKAHFTNLSPGNYTFRVKASNNDGLWNQKERTIHLTILPPWWKTWWAQLLYYSAIALILLGLFQLRVSVIQRQKNHLEKEVNLRTKEVLNQKEELENQARHLSQLNNQKNRLLSIVSHDLRNPLASLQGIASMMNSEMMNDKDLLQDFLTHITEQIDHLGSTMVNLLEWAKSQMEGETINPQKVDLREISKDIVGLYASASDKKGITLSYEIDTPLEVFADPNHVRVILRNLLGNALKFTSESGEIKVMAEKKDDMIITSVKDSGTGMSEEKQASLFSIETNVSTQGTSGEQGVGLGLLLVKEFTEKNMGKIWVESKLNEGSTFHFSLPTA